MYRSGILEIKGSMDVTIDKVAFDSREVESGSLFVAVPGTQVDGHYFILKAIESGAVAIICMEFPEQRKQGVTYIRVKDSSEALG